MINDFFQGLSERGLLIVAGMGFILAMTVALLRYLSDHSKSRFNAEIKRAELSLMRESLESEISRLNRQLVATEDRWQEVNHLIIEGQRQAQASLNGQVERTRFLEQFRVSDKDLSVDPKLVLILTPFAKEEEGIYRGIQTACASAGFLALRGDEEEAPGDILSHVVRLICKARLIIANVGSRNANVFYELGIAQALGKPTLLLSYDQSKPAFDIQGARIFFFSSEQEIVSKLPNVLLKTVANEPVTLPEKNRPR
jgi:hypothetical protein